MNQGQQEDTKVNCSSSVTLRLTNEVSLGDALDIFQDEKISSEGGGGTINFLIDCRRDFEAGDYSLHVVETGRKDNAYVVVMCCDDLCPVKIHDQLKRSNMGDNWRASNYFNRYDWCHMRNFGGSEELWKTQPKFAEAIVRSIFPERAPKFLKYPFTTFFEDPESSYQEDEESDEEDEDEEWHDWGHTSGFLALVYFVNRLRLPEIQNGKFKCHRESNWTWVMKSGDKGDTIGFVINPKRGNGLIAGDWYYGCVLADQDSGKYFAFVFGDFYTNENCEEYPRDPNKLDIGKINYTFNKTQFAKN